MVHHRTALRVTLALLLLATAQSISFSQRAARSIRPQPPTPLSVLGFMPGDDRKIANWAQITDYFQRLDKASDRVAVQEVGVSTLGRPLIIAFISSPENISALNKYKEIQKRLADPRTLQTESERDRALTEGRMIVAISCSIHSTEIVASQMSMQLAYELASAQDPDTLEILHNTILMLIPSPNPDGIDIVADWYRKTLNTPYEGSDPPELYHHYAGHDDNRDWFMLNLEETKFITHQFWKEWFPEIVYDIHQQGQNGSRFFIPPFYDPPNPNIDPLLLREVALFGHKAAADLEAAGLKGVITNSNFDTWWHGGFRTAPYYHNSIGLLSEAASVRLMTPIKVTSAQLERSSTRGMLSAVTPTTNFPDPWPGGEWHARDIMNLEMKTAHSILSLAAKYRRQFLQNFLTLGQNAVANQKEGQPLAYVVPAGQGRDEAVARFIATLLEQGIEVFRLDRELHASFGPQLLQRTNSSSEKIGNYRTIIASTATMQELPAGSYIIFLAQPQRSNVLALFEPQVYPNRVIGGEAEKPYDVTGWTLSMQMGVDVLAVSAVQEEPRDQKLTRIQGGSEVRRDLALKVDISGDSPIQNPLSAPVRIGLYKGAMGNPDEGWTRYIFGIFNVPYKTIDDAQIRKGLSTEDVDLIILPSQRARDITEGNPKGTYPAEFTGGITSAGVAHLKNFVEAGGTLICFDAACELPIKQFNLPVRNVLEGLKSSEFYCPGSLVAIDVERSQLSAPIRPTIDAYFINSSAFETDDPQVRIVARYAKQNLLQSGWLLGEDKLRGRIALANVPLGKGYVVLFGFRPQHRGQTWGTLPLLWNAINEVSSARKTAKSSVLVVPQSLGLSSKGLISLP